MHGEQSKYKSEGIEQCMECLRKDKTDKEYGTMYNILKVMDNCLICDARTIQTTLWGYEGSYIKITCKCGEYTIYGTQSTKIYDKRQKWAKLIKKYGHNQEFMIEMLTDLEFVKKNDM